MITSWSLSRLTDYQQCPRKAKFKHVDRLKEEKGAPLIRGELIHKELEHYIDGRIDKLSPETKRVHALAKKLRAEFQKGKVKVELELAFTKHWKLTEWLAKDAWARIKVDVLRVRPKKKVEVIDWKTGGKVDGQGNVVLSEGYKDQLHLYGVAAVTAGLAEEASGALIYTDHTDKLIQLPELTVRAENIGTEQRRWEKKVLPMLSDNLFAPRPGDYCRWCAFSKKKGGQCEF